MTPSPQSPAYALFACPPIVPKPWDVLAADTPASQEPLPPSGTERHQHRVPASRVSETDQLGTASMGVLVTKSNLQPGLTVLTVHFLAISREP
jgi:hypothetical protein